LPNCKNPAAEPAIPFLCVPENNNVSGRAILTKGLARNF
jgi:hypothetical protein